MPVRDDQRGRGLRCHWCDDAQVTAIWEHSPRGDHPACDACSLLVSDDARDRGYTGWRTVDGTHWQTTRRWW